MVAQLLELCLVRCSSILYVLQALLNWEHGLANICIGILRVLRFPGSLTFEGKQTGCDKPVMRMRIQTGISKKGERLDSIEEEQVEETIV